MINLQAPINTLGYGVAGYNILKELFARDDSVSLYPIGNPDQTDDFIAKAISNISSLKLNRPHVKIWHQHDLFQRVGKGKHLGFPIFELTEFDQRERISLHHCDELMVCSKWASEIVDNQTGIKANVVPLGVDTEIFYPNKVSNPDKTIFFNCGKWEKRKGHDILGECFNRAFTKDDNVELWMMCENPFLKPEQKEHWEKLYKTSGLGDKIRLIPRQRRHEDVARLMNMVDCGVFPARAEGWNL
jgi:glycosyltransferase involved in cell wall biosynthesis